MVLVLRPAVLADVVWLAGLLARGFVGKAVDDVPLRQRDALVVVGTVVAGREVLRRRVLAFKAWVTLVLALLDGEARSRRRPLLQTAQRQLRSRGGATGVIDDAGVILLRLAGVLRVVYVGAGLQAFTFVLTGVRPGQRACTVSVGICALARVLRVAALAALVERLAFAAVIQLAQPIWGPGAGVADDRQARANIRPAVAALLGPAGGAT